MTPLQAYIVTAATAVVAIVEWTWIVCAMRRIARRKRVARALRMTKVL